MKLAGQPRIELLYKQTNLVIPCEKGENFALQRVLDEVGTVDPSKDYSIEIKPKKKARSLDANAYLWVLLRELGKKLIRSDVDLYKEYIRDYGVCEIIPIREDAVNRWTSVWQSKGYGWTCEDMGACRNTKGYHNIKCYYGSSDYDTKEMSRPIDAVVFDCRKQGIETKTPDELAELKQKWGC